MLSFPNFTLCLVVLQMVGATELALAVSLDAPITEKPTIRSEVKRGRQAISTCETHSPVVQSQAYAACINEVLATAAKYGTSTSPFQLGIRYEAFIMLATAHNAMTKSGLADEGPTLVQFAHYAELLNEVGITTEDVCEIARKNCSPIKELMDPWKKKHADIVSGMKQQIDPSAAP
jgi:hypothetical protein